MRGAAMAAKLKADALGQSAATSEVNASPFIQQKIGNAAPVPTPAAAKYMSSAVRGANVLAKLQSDPEAEAEEAATAKAALKSATSAAKAATISAKPAAVVPLLPDPQITHATNAGQAWAQAVSNKMRGPVSESELNTRATTDFPNPESARRVHKRV